MITNLFKKPTIYHPFYSQVSFFNFNLIYLLILFISLSTIIYAQNNSTLPLVRIGTVLDGPWEEGDFAFNIVKKEISNLLSGEFNVEFPVDKTLRCDWDLEIIQSAFIQLLNDPEVDIIIAGGEIASRVAVFHKDLNKPVIAPVAYNAELQGMPMVNGTSGIKNLSYITFTNTVDKDIKAFKKLIDFNKAALLLNELYSKELDEDFLRLILPGKIDLEGVEIISISVGQDIEEVLKNIPADAEVVMISPLHHISYEKLENLVSGLKNKNLPVLSIFDEYPVTIGALMGTVPKDFYSRLARRIALNIQSILLGEEPGNLPVKFPIDMELVINMETAKKLKLYPSWSLMAEARLINTKKEIITRKLTLFDVIRDAVEVHLDVAAKQKEVLAGHENIRKAISNLLPQLEVSATGLLIDKDRAESSFGTQPEKSITGTAAFSQLIYSESVWANLDINKLQQQILEYENEQLKLDIILNASTVYLNVLRSKANELIQIDNLNKSIFNLEIAQFRKDIGYAGPAEVYRWESEIALGWKSLIEINAGRNLAEIELNRLLNRPLEEPFETEEDVLESLVDIISGSRIMKYYSNKWYFKIFRKFLVQEAFQYSPELKMINAAIDAQKRFLTSANNSLYLPTIGIQAELTNSFYRGGVGSKVEPITIPNLGTFSFIEEPKDLSWNVGINISLPLFSGGARYADIAQANYKVSQLEIERKSLEDKIEQQVRSAVHLSGASFAGMKEALKAEEAANKNLELAVDSYTRGATSIVELIDAQNASLVASELAAGARFNFLIDMMNVQRSVGRFMNILSREERDDFYLRLGEFFDENINK